MSKPLEIPVILKLIIILISLLPVLSCDKDDNPQSSNSTPVVANSTINDLTVISRSSNEAVLLWTIPEYSKENDTVIPMLYELKKHPSSVMTINNSDQSNPEEVGDYERYRIGTLKADSAYSFSLRAGYILDGQTITWSDWSNTATTGEIYEPCDSTDPDIPQISDADTLDLYPKLEYAVNPDYPQAALDSAQEGSVWVLMLIGKMGEVCEVYVGQSSGHYLLDSAALEVAIDNTFFPGVQDNQAVWVWAVMEYYFRLNSHSTGIGDIKLK